MRHLFYSVRLSVEQINFSLLTVTLHSSVISKLVYNDTKCSVSFMALYQVQMHKDIFHILRARYTRILKHFIRQPNFQNEILKRSADIQNQLISYSCP